MKTISPSSFGTQQSVLAVGTAQVAIARRAGDVLVAQGLGSCIALCVRDPVARVSGMAHIVLPQSWDATPDVPAAPTHLARFADTAVPHLLSALEREGARIERLAVAIVGGAQILAGAGPFDVGKRNTVAVLQALKERGLMLRAHDIGGHLGRTCRLFAQDGRVLVRPIGADERALTVLGPRPENAGNR